MPCPAPKGQPDDGPGPALTTPRRLASELERLAGDVAAAGLRLRRLSAHVDSATFNALSAVLQSHSVALADLAAGVLLGRVPIVAGGDPGPAPPRYPLFENGTTAGDGGPTPTLALFVVSAGNKVNSAPVYAVRAPSADEALAIARGQHPEGTRLRVRPDQGEAKRLGLPVLPGGGGKAPDAPADGPADGRRTARPSTPPASP